MIPVLAILVLLLLLANMRSTATEKLASSIEISYEDPVSQASQRFGIPKSRIFAMITQESKGEPGALGAAGEIGLMQITAGALADVNRYYGFRYAQSDLFNYEINIQVGTGYLAMLRGVYFSGDLDLATQAYNAGAGNVQKNKSSGSVYLAKVKAYESFY